MNKEERLSQHQLIIDKLFIKETDIVEEITKLIIDFYNNESQDWDNLFASIVDFMYISLKQTYKITINESKEIYPGIDKGNLDKITKKDIDNYTYNKDKKTLKERIKQYILLAKDNKIQKDSLIFKEVRILDNETLVVFHKLLKDKILNSEIEYGMIVAGGGCNRDCCHKSGEEIIPIEDIDEPPYHPNCTCEVIYINPDEEIDE